MLNQANYTTWHYRRNCLSSISQKQQENRNAEEKVLYLDELVKEDLDMATRLGGPNPKVGQVLFFNNCVFLFEAFIKLFI